MDRETPEHDALVAAVASRQHGNIKRQQLLAIGIDDDGIAHRVRTGRLYRVHRGVFAVGRPPRTPLERASAAVLACGAGAALSHLGAFALWGFTATWPAAFDVVVTKGDPRPRGIKVHVSRVLLRRDVRTYLRIRVTSPARTILDCLPQIDPPRRARVVNDALNSLFLSQSDLADVRARFPTHAGARLLDQFIDHAGDGPTRSQMEDEFLRFCARYDLPRPKINRRRGGHEVDALFEEERLIVELDGWRFHRSRDSFERDRDRDADALADGFPTVRVTWGRLTQGSDAEAARLRRILESRRSRPS